MTLYINACVRRESRTNELAKELLKNISVSYVERKLSDEPLEKLSEERLKYRMKQVSEENYDDQIFTYSKEFAKADKIVIAAPFWDLSFPTLLKEYLENIYVIGLVSQYKEDGTPEGLCKAERLYYVTTAGGPYDQRYSYDYIRELCVKYFGIKEVILIKAEMLDIEGYDTDKIMQEAKEKLKGLFE